MRPLASILLTTLTLIATARAADLTVGPGKTFARVEEAAREARPGDTVLIYPAPYDAVAVFVRQPSITFKGVGPKKIKLTGLGFDYSGAGSVPRAIFQFNRGCDACVLDNLELCDAHNQSHNGAGVRINQANNVTVRHCDIHDNDMGIMSNGDGTPNAAAGQRIEYCRIFSNGSLAQPGYNHNLYLGGNSVVLHACEIFASITGHNVKSRAHYTRLEYCWIHDSANRELDLVDGKGDTDIPDSDAVLLGNIIVKDPRCRANRAVIHFGQDGGHDHTGAIYLVNNTIITPFISPVVTLSAPGAKAAFINDLICSPDPNANGQVLFQTTHGAAPDALTVQKTWVSASFTGGGVGHGLLIAAIHQPAFVDRAAGDYRLASSLGAGVPWNEIKLPGVTGALLQFLPPLTAADRPDAAHPAPGACPVKP